MPAAPAPDAPAVEPAAPAEPPDFAPSIVRIAPPLAQAVIHKQKRSGV